MVQLARPAQRTSQPLGYRDIQFMPRERHLFLGKTRSGKSTVMDQLGQHWTHTQPNPRTLILDSKPRFRAEWELNGLSASRRYRNWQRGPTVPDSVALDFSGRSGSIRAQLKQAWGLGHHVVIAQTPEQSELGYLRAAAHWFYADARDTYSQLLIVDELADFFGTTGAASRGDALLKAVRSGGEMNIAFAGGAQRPKGLPQSFMTEVSAVYLFKLQSYKDMAHLESLGLPGDAAPPRQKYVFFYHNLLEEHGGYAKLVLGDVK